MDQSYLTTLWQAATQGKNISCSFPELLQLENLTNRNREKLLPFLDAESQEIFFRFEDAADEYTDLAVEKAFQLGFSAAWRLLLEMY